MTDERFSRTVRLIGEDAVEKINNASVAIFGVGGVGSFVCEALARAWWMRGEVALHMAGQFYEIAAHAQSARSAALERRLAELVADVYRGCIFGDRRRARGFDIAVFDARLAETSPSCHAAVAEVPYSRRIPYRFVKAWRARAWWRWIANALCRIYTRLCACLARLNMGK